MSAPFRINLRDASTLPTRRDEAWRWSDLRRAVSAPVEAAPELPPPYRPGPFSGMEAEETTFANGQLPRGDVLARLRLQDGEVRRLRFVTQADGAGWQAGVDLLVPSGVSAPLLESYQCRGRSQP